jgi:putative hydrolase of the HAD superfamily
MGLADNVWEEVILRRKMKTIDAVIFDFGDTLVSLSPSKEDIFIKAGRSIGLKLNREAVSFAYRMVDFRKKYSSVNIRNDRQRYHFFCDYNRHLCDVLGISDSFEKLNPVLIHRFKKKHKWKLIKDVRFVLKELFRRNILLSVVANWDRGLSSEAERLRIKQYFGSVIASQEVGFEKPDPKIFDYALNKLSLSVRDHTIFYVGNEYETDILGARRAGLVPVLIDRGRHYPHADCMRYESIMGWYRAFILENKFDE